MTWDAASIAQVAQLVVLVVLVLQVWRMARAQAALTRRWDKWVAPTDASALARRMDAIEARQWVTEGHVSELRRLVPAIREDMTTLIQAPLFRLAKHVGCDLSTPPLPTSEG